MKKFIFLQNLVAPYRVSLFNYLFENGLDIEVYYMRLTEGNRSWKINFESMKHPYFIDNGFYKDLNGYYFHFNPRIIKKIFRNKDSELVLGASWNNIDILLLCSLKRLGFLKNKLHIWSEANYLTIGSINDNPIKRLIRNFVFNTIDGNFIVPGEMAVKTFEYWKIHVKRYIYLPNVIDEVVFNSNVVKHTNESNHLPQFVVPIRIDERIKGLINFLDSIGVENIKKGIFYVLGDGPDYEKTKEFIRLKGVEDNVLLVGFCNANQVLNYYQKSDVFILPSFSDPSPLSVVEALSVGLPVLISNRCGNHFESVSEGENGFLIDPSNKNQIKTTFEKILLCRDKWSDMGNASKKKFKDNFKQSSVLIRFVAEMNRSGKQ